GRGAEESLENPLAALHDRGAVGVRRDGEDAALSEDAAAVRVVERDAAVLRAVDVRHAVVLGEALVEEAVVGVEQVEDAAVFAQDAGEEELGLLAEGLAQAVVELGEDV